MEVVMTAVTKRYVMQSYSQINKWAQNFLQAGYPWCRQTNIVKALNGEAVKRQWQTHWVLVLHDVTVMPRLLTYNSFLLMFLIYCQSPMAGLVIIVAPCGLRGCKNRPTPFLPGCRKRRLNQALSIILLVLFFDCVVIYFLCIVSLCWYVFCILVVLVKLSVLAKWLARKRSSEEA